MKTKILVTILLVISFFSCKTWPETTPKSIIKFYATGIAKLSNQNKAETVAETRARASIASQVQSTIKQATIDYIQEAGLAQENQQSLGYIEQISLQLVNIEIPYSKIEKKKIAEDGTVYVLVSVLKSDIRSEFNKKAKLLEKDKKLITKYKSEEALKYLDALIEKP